MDHQAKLTRLESAALFQALQVVASSNYHEIEPCASNWQIETNILTQGYIIATWKYSISSPSTNPVATEL